MRHLVVTRVVAGLAALLVAACLLFARIVTPRAAPAGAAPAGPARAVDGAALFASRCASCHAVADLAVAPAVSGPDDRALTGFLAGHGHSAPAENPVIAAWLRAGAGRR